MNLKVITFWGVLLFTIMLVVNAFLLNTESNNLAEKENYSTISTESKHAEKKLENEQPELNNSNKQEPQKTTKQINADSPTLNNVLVNKSKAVKNESVEADFKLDDTVSIENGQIVFDSDLIDNLNLIQTRDLITDLSTEMYNSESQTIADNISIGLIDDIDKYDGMRLDTTSCSDKVCGILISSQTKSDVASFLDELTSKAHIKDSLKGGSVKVIESNGEFYGVMIGVIGNTPMIVR